MSYTVYILECADKTFYTGYTNNLERRVWEHNHSSKGAKYTHYRRPVWAIYTEEYKTRIEAMRRERQIKQLSRKEKFEVVDTLWKEIMGGKRWSEKLRNA